MPTPPIPAAVAIAAIVSPSLMTSAAAASMTTPGSE
jgi:hypothetical protein